jgi:hypothetical protein
VTDEYDYAYDGEATGALVAAYDADEPPVPTDDGRTYPRRDHLRDEPALVRQLPLPRCWNTTDLLGDPTAVRDRLTALGRRVHAGVTAYGGTDRYVYVGPAEPTSLTVNGDATVRIDGEEVAVA